MDNTRSSYRIIINFLTPLSPKKTKTGGERRSSFKQMVYTIKYETSLKYETFDSINVLGNRMAQYFWLQQCKTCNIVNCTTVTLYLPVNIKENVVCTFLLAVLLYQEFNYEISNFGRMCLSQMWNWPVVEQ